MSSVSVDNTNSNTAAEDECTWCSVHWLTVDTVQSARQGRRAAPATPAADLDQDDDLDTPIKPDVSHVRFVCVHVCVFYIVGTFSETVKPSYKLYKGSQDPSLPVPYSIIFINIYFHTRNCFPFFFIFVCKIVNLARWPPQLRECIIC